MFLLDQVNPGTGIGAGGTMTGSGTNPGTGTGKYSENGFGLTG